MPHVANVDIDISDLTLLDARRQPVGLDSFNGVWVLVLMRHRH